MIERRFIGLQLTPFTGVADRHQLRFFARATGQKDPVYLDEDAAKAAGHASLPIPPTFLFSMELDAPDPQEANRLMGIDLSRLLHGEQHFTYHRTACAGEPLFFEPRIADIYDKKGGALEFVVRTTSVSDRNGARVADLRRVSVVRHG